MESMANDRLSLQQLLIESNPKLGQKVGGKSSGAFIKTAPSKLLVQDPVSRSLVRMISQLAVFMLCFQSCSTAVPVSACTSVSTNIGSSSTTYLPSWSEYTTSMSESQTPAAEKLIFVNSPYDETRQINFYDKNGVNLLKANLEYYGSKFKSVILKDPLKLFLSRPQIEYVDMYLVTVSGSTWSIGTTASDYSLTSSDNDNVFALSSETSTIYVYALSVRYDDDSLYYKITEFFHDATLVTRGRSSSEAHYWTHTVINPFVGLMASNSLLIGVASRHLTLYNKADFSQLRRQYHTNEGDVRLLGHCVDNLDTRKLWTVEYRLYEQTYKKITRFDVSSSGITAVSTNMAYGSNTNNILNFGPYQYVVTMSSFRPSNFLFISKDNIAVSDTYALSNIGAKPYFTSFRGFIPDGDRMYFSVIDDDSNKNFQSYYLTVDRCTTYTNGVCTACPATPPTYYMVTMVGGSKHCFLQINIPAGYGIVSGTTTGQACSSTGCIDCNAAYTNCVSCNTAAGWYRNGAVCQNAASFPVGMGPNLLNGLVETCTTLECATCATNKNVCTACKTSDGWYMNVNICNHATISPVFPDSKGPNLSTGLVQTCTLSRCLRCSANIATCTDCLRTSGWYLNDLNSPVQCQHATISPFIQPGFGPNLSTGKITACLQPNCYNCKSDHLVCQACKIGDGYYLYQAVSPATCLNAASFPTSYGANPSTGKVEPCIPAQCTKCPSTTATCTECNWSAGWYLLISQNQCRSASISPVFSQRYGPDTMTKTVQQCTSIGCLKCDTSISVCQECDTVNGYNLNAEACTYVPPCSVGFSTGNEPCDDNNCKFCCTSKSTCTECYSTNGWYLDGSSCFGALSNQTPQIDDHKGANIATGIVATCADLNCVLCKQDHRVCSQCDFTNLWYLNGAECQHPSNAPIIPDGYGADLGLKNVGSCIVTHCTLCKTDRTVCTGCDRANGWYLLSSLNICQHATLNPFAVGQGPDTSSGLVVQCSTVNCTTCSSSFAVCTACDSNNLWYLNANNCQHPTLMPIIPDGYGANIVSKMVDACSVVNCLLCKTNYQVCTGCDRANGWYLLSSLNICQHATLNPFAVGQGPDTSSGLVVQCSQSVCKDCSTSHTVCTACDASSGWFLNIGMSRCESAISAPTFAEGFGPNLETFTVDQCAIAHCKICVDNINICKVCDQATGWYLYPEDKRCYHKTESPMIPAGYGPNQSTGSLEGCQSTYCLECSDNYQVCMKCQTSLGHLLFEGTCACDISKDLYNDPEINKCVHIQDLVDAGRGGNPSTRNVTDCVDTQCTDCHQNYAVCTKCKTTDHYYLLNSTCVHVAAMPIGQGANLALGIVSQCSIIGCLNCSNDSLACQACDSSKSFVIQGKTCEFKKTEARITVARFVTSQQTAEVEFSAPIKQKSRLDFLVIRFTDSVTNREYSCAEIACSVKSTNENGFSLSFAPTVGIVKGDLYIEATENFLLKFDDGSVWTQYPIKIPDISFISKTGAVAAAGTTMTTMNSARLPISIAISFAAPAAASFIDNLLNTLFLLKMLEGPAVSLPDSILSASMDTNLIPITIDNPFNKWLEKAKPCTPSEQLTKYSVECNMLANEGTNLLQMAGVFVFTAIVTYLSNCLLRSLIRSILRRYTKDKVSLEQIEQKDGVKVSSATLTEEDAVKQSRAARLVKTIGTVLGMQFFLIKLEGNQIEMTLMSIVGLKYTSKSTVDIVSALISSFFIVYYTSIAALCFRQSIWIWDQVEALQRRRKGRKVYKDNLGAYIHLKKAPYPLLNYIFEDMKVPDQYWKLLMPVVIYCRTIAMCLVVTGVLGIPWQQITVATLVESLMVAFEFASDIRLSKAQRWSDILTRVCTIFYLLLKLYSTSNKLAEPTRQNLLGLMMAGTLLAMMLVGAVFAIYIIGVIITESIRTIIKKIKALLELRKLMRENPKNQSMADSSLSRQPLPAPLKKGASSATFNEKSKLGNDFVHQNNPHERPHKMSETKKRRFLNKGMNNPVKQLLSTKKPMKKDNFTQSLPLSNGEAFPNFRGDDIVIESAIVQGITPLKDKRTWVSRDNPKV